MQQTYMSEPTALHRNLHPLAFTDKLNAVSMMVTNCESKRRKRLIQEIMGLLPVASFGNCMRTKNLSQELPHCHIGKFHPHKPWFTGREEKECMLYHHKFTLAFENSVDENYISEKLWQALKMGTVPVYWVSLC